MITLAEVNNMSAAEFVAAFGDIAEHSPWVAERAFKIPHPPVGTFSHLQEQTGEGVLNQPSPVPLGMGEGGQRPDEGSFYSRDEILIRFTRAVLTAPEALQLSLLRAHPDLATRAKLTADSTTEQRGAGLDNLSAEEFARFTALNNQYKEQNGFPFIFAVKGATKHQILESFEKRIHHSRAQEFQVALKQVCKIIGFRLEARVIE
jgi:2-oxo-4-hydroxy-4-carboxy-5-ureidoimidazoline decarboxylase